MELLRSGSTDYNWNLNLSDTRPSGAVAALSAKILEPESSKRTQCGMRNLSQSDALQYILQRAIKEHSVIGA
jgi:hypothetical protein